MGEAAYTGSSLHLKGCPCADDTSKPPVKVPDPDLIGVDSADVAVDTENTCVQMTTGKGNEGCEASSEDAANLYKLGINTVVAITLHNFPEGLATYLSSCADGRTGISIAFGVIPHNIPEGLCVAAPIFVATQSRSSAIGWAAVAGFAELMGGFTGWMIMEANGGGDMNPEAYGVIYGFVCGVVVQISAVEFLPSAIRYDETHGKYYVGIFFFLGMVVLASTLIVEMM